ncbi:MAG TPA: 30S ribosomal protein S16 [Acholeplasma sp.]|nr:30S ribosomal protein S16 [Acholeplasma sp.]
MEVYMVKLRLQRLGAKKRPYYRIVATESSSPRDGRFIEIIGTYHPIEKDQLKINEEKALKWLHNGAQPTDTVKSLFTKVGIIEKFTEEKKAKRA